MTVHISSSAVTQPSEVCRRRSGRSSVVAASQQFGADQAGVVAERLSLDVWGCTLEGQLADLSGWNDVEMGVGDLISSDDQSDALTGVHRLLCSPDRLGHCEQVGAQIGVSVDPVIDLHDGDDQDMAVCHRVDRHERHASGVTPHEMAGQFAVDDPREDGGHLARFAHPRCCAP